MAELATEELWDGLPSGPARADEAVRLARASGSAKALAYALIPRVMARVFAGDGGGFGRGPGGAGGGGEGERLRRVRRRRGVGGKLPRHQFREP